MFFLKFKNRSCNKFFTVHICKNVQIYFFKRTVYSRDLIQNTIYTFSIYRAFQATKTPKILWHWLQ